MKKINIAETLGNAQAHWIYLGEERCNDWPSNLFLSFQLNLNQNWTPTAKKHGNTH